MYIRELLPSDREAAIACLRACPGFSLVEIRVAMEVLDAGLAGGLEGDYPLFGAEIWGEVRGYVCVGPTPMTLSTWHLYWICVHPCYQHRGVGRALHARVEEFVRPRGAERLVLETSSREEYAPQRRFYERAGYLPAGRIEDYYKPGDDCVLYVKRL